MPGQGLCDALILLAVLPFGLIGGVNQHSVTDLSSVFGAAASGLSLLNMLTGTLTPQSLSFARAASVMRACAYKIQPGTDPATLHLPFVGRARAAQICDLATTGTTAELEEHRYSFLPCHQSNYGSAPHSERFCCPNAEALVQSTAN